MHTTIIVLHILFSLLALVAVALMFSTQSGSPRHRRIGQLYSILLTSSILCSLFVIPGMEIFSPEIESPRLLFRGLSNSLVTLQCLIFATIPIGSKLSGWRAYLSFYFGSAILLLFARWYYYSYGSLLNTLVTSFYFFKIGLVYIPFLFFRSIHNHFFRHIFYFTQSVAMIFDSGFTAGGSLLFSEEMSRTLNRNIPIQVFIYSTWAIFVFYIIRKKTKS